jgi:hypothetical protein
MGALSLLESLRSTQFPFDSMAKKELRKFYNEKVIGVCHLPFHEILGTLKANRLIEKVRDPAVVYFIQQAVIGRLGDLGEGAFAE